MTTDPAPGAPAGSSVVLVLGAGRSGTSLLTRGVQALGVDLGDRLRPAGGKNPTGFFEDRDLLSLTKRLKHALNVKGHSVRLLGDEEWQAPAVQALQREAVETIRRRFGNTPLWGFKHGRTLRFLPFWEDVFRELDMETRYVVALRNPLSVARSRAKLHPERGRPTWSCLEWLTNVVPYFHLLRGRPFAVVDFDNLVDAPAAQLERAAAGLALPVDEAIRTSIDDFAQRFLRTGMRHSRYTLEDLRADPDMLPLLIEAYVWLDRLARDETGPADEALWRDWQRIENHLRELAPLLQEMDWLRGRLERTRWDPFSPGTALRQLWRDWRSS